MKVELQCGDTITIPEGCKVTIKDNQIVVEPEGFKDGDILVEINDTRYVLIFKRYQTSFKNTFYSYYNNKGVCDLNWASECFRLATEEEKQVLFGSLKSKGYRWNAEAKQIELIRKKAKYGDIYLSIDKYGEIQPFTETLSYFSTKNFNTGNYYLLEERKQAEENAATIRAIFEKRIKV